jgi:pilus assembly protein CpaB
MGRRVIGVLASLVLAAFGTLVLLAYVRGAEQRALAGERVVEVLIVTERVGQGTPAEQLSTKVISELVPVKVQALGSVASLEELTGKVASIDLLPGEQVLTTRFVAPEALQAQKEIKVPDGLLEVTVSLEPQRALGGQLVPGDQVAVVASFDPFDLTGAEPDFDDGSIQPEDTSPAANQRTPNSTHLLLYDVLVTAVQLEQLPPEREQAAEGENLPDLAPTGNLLITLAVDPPSAERVIFTAEHGFLWLTAENGAVSGAGTQIETRMTVYQ